MATQVRKQSVDAPSSTIELGRICELLQLCEGTVHLWIRKGIIEPAVLGGKGKGNSNRFDLQQCMGLIYTGVLMDSLRPPSVKGIARIYRIAQKMSYQHWKDYFRRIRELEKELEEIQRTAATSTRTEKEDYLQAAIDRGEFPVTHTVSDDQTEVIRRCITLAEKVLPEFGLDWLSQEEPEQEQKQEKQEK